MKFQGLYTAIVTPFVNGRIDEDAFEKLIEDQVAAGVTGVVAVGTTGESPTLDVNEHLLVIRLAVKFAAGRIQVIAGTGANSTAEAIHMTLEAEEAGVDGTLQVCPYYNKPSQAGVYAHFKAIADATKLPIMLYSIPGRCGIEIGVETIARLAKDCPNIICVKEAGGSVDRVNQLMQVVPEDFTILCGDDGLTVPFMSCGAVGLVSVTSNLVPGIMNELVQAGLNQDMAEMLRLQKKYYPLMKGLMSLDTNPVPIKAALAMRGDIQDCVRLPLVPLAEEKKPKLEALLKSFSIL
ncbi:MAG: 4-hydroxy-tetrahydrodipicolinate synthase [Akkermansia sp.]|nr:4-hydroxy-tetrahydrodipicolinate synthase [Akkermansia sp.]